MGTKDSTAGYFFHTKLHFRSAICRKKSLSDYTQFVLLLNNIASLLKTNVILLIWSHKYKLCFCLFGIRKHKYGIYATIKWHETLITLWMYLNPSCNFDLVLIFIKLNCSINLDLIRLPTGKKLSMPKLISPQFSSLCDSRLELGHNRTVCKFEAETSLMMLQASLELIRVANIDSPCRVGHYPRSQFSYFSCSKSWHMCSPTVTDASNFWKKLAFLRLKAVKDTHMLQFVPIGSNLLLLSFFFRASFTLPVSCFDLQQF